MDNEENLVVRGGNRKLPHRGDLIVRLSQSVSNTEPTNTGTRLGFRVATDFRVRRPKPAEVTQ
jgi:hypothetical protein